MLFDTRMYIIYSSFYSVLRTKLDRSETDEYKQREVRAAQLAGEIETKDKSDILVDDIGTEEEMCVTLEYYIKLILYNIYIIILLLQEE